MAPHLAGIRTRSSSRCVNSVRGLGRKEGKALFLFFLCALFFYDYHFLSFSHSLGSFVSLFHICTVAPSFSNVPVGSMPVLRAHKNTGDAHVTSACKNRRMRQKEKKTKKLQMYDERQWMERDSGLVQARLNGWDYAG